MFGSLSQVGPRNTCKASWWPSKGQCGKLLVMVISRIYTNRGKHTNALNYAIQVSNVLSIHLQTSTR